eukprot:745617-Hanusia_phi.AAC.1
MLAMPYKERQRDRQKLTCQNTHSVAFDEVRFSVAPILLSYPSCEHERMKEPVSSCTCNQQFVRLRHIPQQDIIA